MNTFKLIVKNAREVQAGFALAQTNSKKWTRSALSRGGKRIIRAFKKAWLSGPPGIEGGQFKKGKHAFSYPRFGAVDDVTVGISRILRVHEEGATIKAKTDALYLSKKAGPGIRTIFAMVQEVRIPQRTQFRLLVENMAPDVAKRVGEANVRAIEQAMKGTMQRVLS
jgi:hypothetical protein